MDNDIYQEDPNIQLHYKVLHNWQYNLTPSIQVPIFNDFLSVSMNTFLLNFINISTCFSILIQH